MHPRRGLAGGLVALLATAALAACSDGGSGASGDTVDIGGGYVALGDSYSAAPGVPKTDVASGCYRSDHNYPSLLAEHLDASTVSDVTCSGASTASMTAPGKIGDEVVAPQLDALDDDTALVTVGIGGNDLDVFATFTGTCLQAAPSDPDGAPCQAQLTATGTDTLLTDIGAVGDLVQHTLEQVTDRAPDADVLLVGYPQLVPETGTCPDRLPLAEGDYPYVRAAVTALNQALETAADAAGVTFVDVAAISEGHDVCAGEDAWIQGVATDPDKALALHPFEVEQQAVADLVLEQVQQG